jgi:hypothetical protein
MDANWLPAPEGDFLLLLHAYHPRPAFLDGSFQLSSFERLGQIG